MIACDSQRRISLIPFDWTSGIVWSLKWTTYYERKRQARDGEKKPVHLASAVYIVIEVDKWIWDGIRLPNEMGQWENNSRIDAYIEHL